MTKLIITLIILIFTSTNIFSQNNEKIQTLINLAEQTIKNIESTSKTLEIKKRLKYRKIKISGIFDNDTKLFTKTIKYYKSGLKREEIKVYVYGYDSSGKKSLKIKNIIIIIVKINNKIHFIKNFEYGKDYVNNFNIKKTETFSDDIYLEENF